MTTAAVTTTVTTTVGIDVGADSTKVNLGQTPFRCELVRTATGDHTFPTAVSFAGKVRNIGENANVKASSAGSVGISHLNRLLFRSDPDHLSGGDNNSDSDKLQQFYRFDVQKPTNSNNDAVMLSVDYNGQQQSFSADAVLSMLLSKIKDSAGATMDRLQSNTSNETTTITTDQPLTSIVTVPPGLSVKVWELFYNAAYAAGFDNSHIFLVETPAAYAACYQRKFPQRCSSENEPFNILLVDMGHAQTTVSVIQFGGSSTTTNSNTTTTTSENHDHDDEKAATDESTKTDETTTEAEASATQFNILCSQCSHVLGAGSVDVRLWHHFQSTMTTSNLQSLQPKSRKGARLLEGSHKLKHLLSQLPEAQVTVENVGDNDSDLTLTATRTLLADLCQPEAAALTELIQSVLKQAAISKIHAVEIVGGGCRIPFVQTAIQKALPTNDDDDKNGDNELILSRSFDDTSAALGAAVLGEMLLISAVDSNNSKQQQEQQQKFVMFPPDAKRNIVPTEYQKQLRQAEQAMSKTDQDQLVLLDLRNKLESHILELRSAKHGKYGALLPTTDNALDTFLDQTDDWLFSEEAEEASKDQMETKLKETLEKTKSMCQEYYQAIQKEEERKEQEMEKAAKEAALERQGQDQTGDEEDHDNRRLPKKRRMEIVMKNKAEANELFSGGNYKIAAARYTKALSHCAKFVDLAPDDKTEVNQVKTSLNINLALAYLKLDNPDQALRVMNDVMDNIEGSQTNPKALYRRASVYYEKKNWQAAKKDIQTAQKLPGVENDKAIQKLDERIELQLKKQKQKEKKMAAKMFS